MKARLVRSLACPACRGPLALAPERPDGEELVQGQLQCPCGAGYPIRGGIPRFTPPPAPGAVSDGQAQVARSFGNKWTQQPRWGLAGATADFFRQWMLEKYGWETEEGFRRSLADRGRLLDAGAGLGREMRHLARANPAAEVVGIELSEAVDVAQQVTADLPRAHLVQGDILAPPFPPASFDFILSEGVLHHTPDTRRALAALVECLAPGGEIAFYVYRRKGPLREFADDLIRERVSRLAPEDCWGAVAPLTQLGRALHALQATLEIPEAIPILGIAAGRYDVQRFVYDHVLKCFWNPAFTFDENNLVNFDWYHPAYAHRHTADEVRAWVGQLGLRLIHVREEASGITVRAIRLPGRAG